MSRSTRRLAIGSAALAALLFASPASAQFRVPPRPLPTAGVLPSCAVPVPRYSPVYNPSPCVGDGGLRPRYAAPSSVADLVTANAQALVTQQVARLVNEQVLRAQLDNRRALIEQARRER